MLIALDNKAILKNNETEWGIEMFMESAVLQPDGISIVIEKVFLGKNNPLMVLRKDGFTVIQDSETEYYCWARQSKEGLLESTGKPIHLYNPNDLGLEKNIRISDEAFKKWEELQ